MPVLNTQALIDNRCEAIKRYHEATDIKRAELDVSGGLDSAVMLGLLARALGPENVTAVYSNIHSSDESRSRARDVAKAFGVKLCELEVIESYDDIVQLSLDALGAAGYDMEEIGGRLEADPTIKGSLRSTLRAPLGRFMNRLTGGGIRHGTGNECEDRWLRFYQKGGDGEVDTNPIAMLSKGEVFQLGRALGVPREILTAVPTPDLWGIGDGHTDEDEIAKISNVEWTYSRVDPDTGEYTRVGTIERLSRFLDRQFSAWFDGLCIINGGWLFGKDKGSDGISGDWEFNMDYLVKEAKPFFDPDYSENDVRDFLTSARKWERITRHKANPNCPTLGPGWQKMLKDGLPLRKKDREVFIEDGILTNKLPKT